MRLALVTLDHHLTGAFHRVAARLHAEQPGLELSLHVAADWEGDPGAAGACEIALERADIAVVTQMFMPQHSGVILPVLRTRRNDFRALICLLSEGPVTRLTRMGGFSMGGDGDGDEDGGGRMGGWFRGILRKLRTAGGSGGDSGKRQLRMLRRIPRILRFIPGKAQDLRAYFLALQYWLSGSEENLEAMLRMVLSRYGEVEIQADPGEAREYLETGLYHPDLPGVGLTDSIESLPTPAGVSADAPAVGVLLMRSYLLAGNTAHYDAVIRALESKGLRAIPAFAAGLDNAPVVERWFIPDERDPAGSRIEVLVSLTGFSLVGGPAYNDARTATELLERLDVPYLALQPLEFQTIEAWEADPRGLTPLQGALNVALPELDGAIAPTVFGGRSIGGEAGASLPIPERIERVARRVEQWVELRRARRADRKVGVVLFNFPPNGGAVGTAAFLDVWASLYATLRELAAAGYSVGELPATADALRERVLGGNRDRFGTPAHVHHRIPVDDHVAREPWLHEIEAVWGQAPGRSLTDGASLLVQGVRFGNVFVGIQPPFGWEGDPMRLLFSGGFAPTHAFSAFYRWLREDFGAHALLHFGTHGAVEFMPGKHVGLSEACWPERLLGSTPLFYLYAANNPSEGTMAKRRGGAVTVSHLTPPVLQAGLYRGLLDLRGTVDRLRALGPDPDPEELAEGLQTARDLAAALDLEIEATPDDFVGALHDRLIELEQALIPHGLHVVGRRAPASERSEMVRAAVLHAPPPTGELSDTDPATIPAERLDDPAFIEALDRAVFDVAESTEGTPESRAGRAAGLLERVGVDSAVAVELLTRAARLDAGLRDNGELPGMVRALDGRYLPPAPAGDLLRTPDLLPTGRNLTAFDPWRVPSAWAMREGKRQAETILRKHADGGHGLPESVAMVLWGTDNLKREGAPIGQALALMGAEPRFDHYGRLAGARLVPLEELGRPRVDVIVTTSGIFRDLLPLQMRVLAEAAWLASQADEPAEMNFVRKHTLAHAAALECSMEEAAHRVFSNQDGAYGAQVNQLVDAGSWAEEDELGNSFVNRKGFAYGRDGRGRASNDLFRQALSGVTLTYQNVESVELGVSDLDQYFDSLGGLTRAARAGRSDEAVPAYVGDETRGEGKVRTLEEQIDLETRTRILNPRWIEGMLEHGYQGVREIEARVTNQVGWSATTGAVPEWVYREVGQTFVLDPEMRRRLSELNPEASSRMAQRLLEATDRGYWSPDDETLDALRDAADELDDRLEGIETEVAA
ncbi:MAG: magnesium chelatase subunit H [Gemmatimonadales bacterium]|nr:MAG: magnesium chelatase subunit H [Gemmatimonadales bacterium]